VKIYPKHPKTKFWLQIQYDRYNIDREFSMALEKYTFRGQKGEKKASRAQKRNLNSKISIVRDIL
jgi:hypothetical protein